MSAAREAFLRRFAASPIHVPRLERLLAAYESQGDEGETFAAAYVQWDRECPSAEAGRLVTELLSTVVNHRGQIVRFSERAVVGAMRWMAGATAKPIDERLQVLRELLSSSDEAPLRRASDFLEMAAVVDDADLPTFVPRVAQARG